MDESSLRHQETSSLFKLWTGWDKHEATVFTHDVAQPLRHVGDMRTKLRRWEVIRCAINMDSDHEQGLQHLQIRIKLQSDRVKCSQNGIFIWHLHLIYIFIGSRLAWWLTGHTRIPLMLYFPRLLVQVVRQSRIHLERLHSKVVLYTFHYFLDKKKNRWTIEGLCQYV